MDSSQFSELRMADATSLCYKIHIVFLFPYVAKAALKHLNSKKVDQYPRFAWVRQEDHLKEWQKWEN